MEKYEKCFHFHVFIIIIIQKHTEPYSVPDIILSSEVIFNKVDTNLCSQGAYL